MAWAGMRWFQVLYRWSFSGLLATMTVVVFVAGSGAETLTLRQKNPGTWQVVETGARGELTFDRQTGGFHVRAAELRPHREYALIRYADKPPTGHIVARGRADRFGELHLAGTWREWSGKFWVVLAADVRGRAGDYGGDSLDTLKGWHPRDYLFEERPL